MSSRTHIEVRQAFLRFFDRKFREYAKSKGEDPAKLPPMILPSSSLVPDDASTLFTSAGMHQFKDDFTGNLKHGTKRATTAQKCLRTPDLENVGKTARHHTFFEMLGFFSFGDYFKKEAIAWIWEFYTKEMGLSKEKLRVSVYQDDIEAYELWQKLEPKLHERRWIYRFGENDNFWPAGSPSQGPNGVCGPCSEIFYDLGATYDKPALNGADDPSNNGDRFMEIGNIVFTQFDRSGPIPGKGTLTPLPAKNIDFGGGMERLMVALEGVMTTLDTSLFLPLRNKLRWLAERESTTGFKSAGPNEKVDFGPTSDPPYVIACDCLQKEASRAGNKFEDHVGHADFFDSGRWRNLISDCGHHTEKKWLTLNSERIDLLQRDAHVREKRIADHIRCAVFAIADGVVPSNEKQGYILRRILRRAYRDGSKLGFKGPFLHKLVDAVNWTYGDVNSAALQNVPKELRGIVAYAEVSRAPSSISDTIRQEEEAFDKVLQRGLDKVAGYIADLKKRGAKTLDGALAFDLHSTYGLPVDVTRDELTEAGLALDETGFQKAKDEFEERSRVNSGFSGDVFEKGWFATFKVGKKPTEFLGYETTRAAGNVLAIAHNEQLVDYIREGSTAVVVLDKSPFYGESGGQVGDTGVLQTPMGRFVVADTKKREDFILHTGKLESGKLSVSDTVEAVVDSTRRDKIRANHSATHLLHAALRKVLGEHVQQRGSEVAQDRLRFDFTHPKSISWEERLEIERIVNEQIVHNADVRTDVTDPETARKAGAMALFGEKYGDKVRVLSMGDTVGATHGSPANTVFSRELCGGTHVRRTGDIGFFRITAESSSSAGVRRIEAVTGLSAVQAAQADAESLLKMTALLKTPPDKLLARLEAMQKEIKELKSGATKAKAASVDLKAIAASAQKVGDAFVVVTEVGEAEPPEMLTMVEQLKQDMQPLAVLLGAKSEGRASLCLAFSPELVKRGLHAGKLVGELAAKVGGKGGGKPEFAQAGGKDPNGLAEALKLGRERLLESLAK
ncbi:alanyl-tRNA synthetase [Planctomycetaceae bacterium]|nr:alanyl-tRNA synthetase [Planctomycetaceae bacterium]